MRTVYLTAIPLFLYLASFVATGDGDELSFLNLSSTEISRMKTPCGKGWYAFGNMCYRLGGIKRVGKLNWENAAKRCAQAYSGNLATVDSKELNDFLTAFLVMAAKDRVWIGLHDRVNESIYSWDDGSPLDYTNWEPNEPSGPSNDKEDCVHLTSHTGQWNDIDCGGEYQYICQKERGTKMALDSRFCPPDVGYGFSLETSCFYIYLDKKPWADAEKFCSEQHAGHLVTITDFTVGVFLDYLLRDREEEFWIGIKSKEEYQQQWSSGWYVSYENWAGEEEHLTEEGMCGFRLHGGKWSTTPCKTSLSFICETSKVVPPVLKKAPKGAYCPPEPPDWRDLGGESCYFFDVNSDVSWVKANFLCMRRGGSLLSIHSKEEVNMLNNFVRHAKHAIYIGFYRHLLHDDEFVWADGSLVDYLDWDSGEPNAQREQCTELRQYNMKWNDMDCDTTRGYMCSVPKLHLNKTIEKAPTPCLIGFTLNALLGVIFCVVFVSALVGLLMYFSRLCDRGYKRLRKTSGTKHPAQGTDADVRPRYRSEIIVKDDANSYENVA